MRKLHLEKLEEGLPEISPKVGAFLVEAAIVCLEINGHFSGINTKGVG